MYSCRGLYIHLACIVTATEIQNLDSLPAGTVIQARGLVARMLGDMGCSR